MSHSVPFRLSLGCSAIALATALAAPAAAQSFQGSANVVFGSATVTTGTGTTNIDIASNSAVIDWTPNDTAINNGAPIAWQPAGTTAVFNGSAGPFAVLNRIVPADTSRPITFDGNVQSQFVLGQALFRGGTVFFYSPGGIVIGPNAVFDIGSLGLTTAPPRVDANGAFFTNNTLTLDQASSGSAVRIQPGARINAIAPGSYVAIFAPYVEQHGTVAANGQVALVAGEAGTFTYSPDGLFDIQVTTGTDGQNGAGISTFGTTTGGASTGPGDNRRVYLVAVPKNQLLTMAIQRGASLGFEVAGAANVDGNAVVLSAGYNVTRGAAETARAGGSGTGTITINDGSSGLSGRGIDFTSAVTANASGDLLVDVFRQTRFASDVYLRADGLARVQVNTTNDAGGFQPVPGGGSAVVPGFNASAFAPTDDSFLVSDLGFAANFFGNSYTSTFVSSNGYVTFGQGSASFTPTGLGENYSGLPIIAAFFADIDTRGSGDNDITFGQGTFGGRNAFGANWPGVGRFSRLTDKLNNFQILLVDRADTGVGNFDILLNYNSIQWESSGGSGFGGNSAAVGYNAGTGNQPGTFFEFPGSRVPGSFIDGAPLALASNSNVGEAGRYVFTVRNGDVAPAVSRGLLEVGGNLTVSATRPGLAAASADAGTAQVNLAGGNANVAGTLRVEAEAFRDASGNGIVTGGLAQASLTGGGTLSVGNDVIVAANSINQSGPATQGGTAGLSLDETSTATVGRVTRVLGYGVAGLNVGFSGTGGAGTGGNSTVAVNGGSRFTTGELNIAADGVGGRDAGNGGGAGTGGAAAIRVGGANSALTVLSSNVTGDIDLGERDMVSAEGFGGTTNIAGAAGGVARGGAVEISVNAGGTLALSTAVNAQAAFLARGHGGAGRGTDSTGGAASGGSLAVTVNGGSLTGEGLLPSSFGQGGGNFSGPQSLLVNGGDGTGGTRSISFTNGATFTGSIVGGCACGLGGPGTAGGRGGNAIGGTATTIFDASTANVSARGLVTFDSSAGGNGASDGNVTGGTVNVAVRNGSTVNLADGASFLAEVNNTTNVTGQGPSTPGGNATAGNATLTIDNSTITGNGILSVAANGRAGADQSNVGTGRAGTALFQTNATSTIDVASLTVGADGTTRGQAGVGGSAAVDLRGTTMTADTVAIGAAGSGGATALQLANSTLTTGAVTVTGPGNTLLDLASSTITANNFAVDAGTFVLPAARPATPGTITAPTLTLNVAQGGSIRTYASFVTTGNRSFSTPEIVLGNFRTTGSLSLDATAGYLAVGNIESAEAALTAIGAIEAGVVTSAGGLTATSSTQGISLAGANAAGAEVLLQARTNIVAGAITASSINADAGATATVQGAWAASGVGVRSADIAITDAGSIAAQGSIHLVSTSPTQTIVGDTQGAGWVLSNNEFSRLRAPEINITANSDASNPITLLVGDLEVRGFQAGANANLTTEDGVLNFFTSSEGFEGTVRVAGRLRGTSFTADNAIDFDADIFELDAVNGLAELLDSSGQLSGNLELEANRIWVASPEILGRLEANPSYEGRITDINTPLAVPRPDGVVRARFLNVEERPPVQVLVQNTGTNALPAGFLATSSGAFGEDNDDPVPPASIELVINGQVIVDGQTLTGSAVVNQLISQENRAAFSATSTINACSVDGRCGGQGLASASTIASEIGLLSDNTLAEEPFEVEESSEEEEEESDSAAQAAIEPPAVLIDTRPLNPPLDIADPVSGSGNPASLSPTPDAGDDQ